MSEKGDVGILIIFISVLILTLSAVSLFYTHFESMKNVAAKKQIVRSRVEISYISGYSYNGSCINATVISLEKVKGGKAIDMRKVALSFKTDRAYVSGIHANSSIYNESIPTEQVIWDAGNYTKNKNINKFIIKYYISKHSDYFLENGEKMELILFLSELNGTFIGACALEKLKIEITLPDGEKTTVSAMLPSEISKGFKKLYPV